jgi:hypothetical protein
MVSDFRFPTAWSFLYLVTRLTLLRGEAAGNVSGYARRLVEPMTAIEVRPVCLPEDARRFVNTWWTVYGGDPCWVPPLQLGRSGASIHKTDRTYRIQLSDVVQGEAGR